MSQNSIWKTQKKCSTNIFQQNFFKHKSRNYEIFVMKELENEILEKEEEEEEKEKNY